MTIRFATVEDLPVIGQLAHEIWPAVYGELLSKEQIEYMLGWMYSQEALKSSGQTFLIAEIDGQAIGFAAYTHTKLHKLYVQPGLHGKGIGKQLIDFIIKEITAQGATHLQLNVKRDNPARFFYEKLGFVIVDEVDIDIGKGYFMRDYVMEKALS